MPKSGSSPSRIDHKQEILACLLAMPIKNAQVAEIAGEWGLSITESRVSVLRNSPLMQALVTRVKTQLRAMILNQYIQSAGDRLNEIIPPALDRLENLVHEAENDSTLLGAIKTVLDYAPDAPKSTKHLEASHKHTTTVDADAVRSIEKALAQTDQFFDPKNITPDSNDPDPDIKKIANDLYYLPPVLNREDEQTDEEFIPKETEEVGKPIRIKSIEELNHSLSLEDKESF